MNDRDDYLSTAVRTAVTDQTTRLDPSAGTVYRLGTAARRRRRGWATGATVVAVAVVATGASMLSSSALIHKGDDPSTPQSAAAAPEEDFALPVSVDNDYGDIYGQALFEGNLQFQDNCPVIADSSGETFLVAFSRPATGSKLADGSIAVLKPDGKVQTRSGSVVGSGYKIPMSRVDTVCNPASLGVDPEQAVFLAPDVTNSDTNAEVDD
jgi:hypothetical protein